MSLNSRTVATLVKAGNPGMWAGAHGLQLVIAKSGTPSWALRYLNRDGKRRLMKLADLDDTDAATIAAMEGEAAGMRARIKKGFDPLAERQVSPTVPAAPMFETFKAAALDYIAANKPTWKNDKHIAQWESTLDTYVYPMIGDRPVHTVSYDDVDALLKQHHRRGGPLWTVARETANRIRARIEMVIDAAKAKGLADNSNPARQALWAQHSNPAERKVLKHTGLNGKQVKGHFKAMPFEDVPHFAKQLRCKDDYSARALLLTILCAVRSNETFNAQWSEFDIDGAVWTIPAERMKAGKAHRVPLSASAVKLLQETLRMEGNPYVFPGAKRERPLSNMAMLEALRGMRPKAGFTVHGFRSSFRDWISETTLHPDAIAEHALAHTISDKTVAAYRRGDAFDRRVKLMQHWDDYMLGDMKIYINTWSHYLVT